MCTEPVSAVDGYVLPTDCTDFTTGSIDCSAPTCAPGWFGTPVAGDMTCVTSGEELSVSGCTECAGVANGEGAVTCTAGDNSVVAGCASGYHKVETCGAADTCEANVCMTAVAVPPAYATLPMC